VNGQYFQHEQCIECDETKDCGISGSCHIEIQSGDMYCSCNSNSYSHENTCIHGDETFHFEDPNLELCVKERAGTYFDDDLKYSDIINIEDLSCENRNIGSIKGIEMLSNLKDVTLYNNSIENISHLSKLTKLESVNLSRNKIRNISPLASLKQVSDIDLYSNKIEFIPNLNELRRLYYLDVGYNLLTTLSGDMLPISLSRLSVNDNSITTVSNMERLENLYYLDLTYNRISNVQPFATMTSDISIHYNCIEDFYPVQDKIDNGTFYGVEEQDPQCTICLDISCGENAECVVNDHGDGECACIDGYENRNGSCYKICDKITCSENSACVIDYMDNPFCECEEGFIYEGNR